MHVESEMWNLEGNGACLQCVYKQVHTYVCTYAVSVCYKTPNESFATKRIAQRTNGYIHHKHITVSHLTDL